MNEQEYVNEQNQKMAKLALKFEVNHDELLVLCHMFSHLRVGENLSPAEKALNLVRLVKHAINLKFDNKIIDEKHEYIRHYDIPKQDNTKAKLVKGLFLTFVEHERGLPGLISILSGIGAAGFGFGKFKIKGFSEKISLAEIKEHRLPEHLIINSQAEFFNRTLTPENLEKFPNVRLGVYCLITGCALIPVYASILKRFDDQNQDDMHLVQNAEKMVEDRFLATSETLKRFINQNLFRVIFEELFNYESTVYSIYS
ncbi:MAG: hypothetical protein PWR01_3032 [Clostridiales bacterium]|jgi:hypothetical protein|nr:hypothetical protein [Clostridiales bacterium]MDN5281959.1 hypothetical protein [Candidatus Ozemobacter sp.]